MEKFLRWQKNQNLFDFRDRRFWPRYQFRLIRAGVKRANPLFVGIGSTKLFLALVGLLAILPQKNEQEWSLRILSFLTSPSNEIGDTFAGIAGALAFLWIIVTVMLQSQELAAQREELKLTRIEFEKMARAQDKQVDLLVQQGEIFAAEQRQRVEAVGEKLLNEKLEGVRSTIENELQLAKILTPDSTDKIFSLSFRAKASGKTEFTSFYYRDIDLETYFAKRRAELQEKIDRYFLNERSLVEYKFNTSAHLLFKRLLEELADLEQENLGLDQIVRLKRFDLNSWGETLNLALTQECEI